MLLRTAERSQPRAPVLSHGSLREGHCLLPVSLGGRGLLLASHLAVSLLSQVTTKQMWESGGSSVALQGRSISKKTGSYRQAGVRVTAGGNRKFCVYFQFKMYFKKEAAAV